MPLVPSILFDELALLFAVNTITLLVVAVFSSPIYGMTNLTVNRTKLRHAAFLTAAVALVFIILKVLYIIFNGA